MEETDFLGERTKDAYNFALRITDNADINAIRNTLNLRDGWGRKFWLHITSCDLPKALDDAVVANAHGNDKLCKAMLKVTIDNPEE